MALQFPIQNGFMSVNVRTNFKQTRWVLFYLFLSFFRNLFVTFHCTLWTVFLCNESLDSSKLEDNNFANLLFQLLRTSGAESTERYRANTVSGPTQSPLQTLWSPRNYLSNPFQLSDKFQQNYDELFTTKSMGLNVNARLSMLDCNGFNLTQKRLVQSRAILPNEIFHAYTALVHERVVLYSWPIIMPVL